MEEGGTGGWWWPGRSGNEGKVRRTQTHLPSTHYYNWNLGGLMKTRVLYEDNLFYLLRTAPLSCLTQNPTRTNAAIIFPPGMPLV